MNYIAALMLLVLKDEERTFWLFDTLVTEILPGALPPTPPLCLLFTVLLAVYYSYEMLTLVHYAL